VDAVIRAPFGDERLRAVERINGELDPAPIANEVLLQEHVVNVMPRISFMPREIERALDVDRQLAVDLDLAAVVSLVPVVAAPRLVFDVLDGKRLLGREL